MSGTRQTKIYGNVGIECRVRIGFCITNHFQKNTNYISDLKKKKKLNLRTSNLIEVQKSMEFWYRVCSAYRFLYKNHFQKNKNSISDYLKKTNLQTSNLIDGLPKF